MSKKLQQTLTGAMAAMMATGVVATPVMADTTNVDAIYRSAFEATQKALEVKTQESINLARVAIKALPESFDWAIGEFSKQLDTVQHPILVNIVTSIKTAQTEKTQASVNAAKASLAAGLPQVWLNSYSSAIDEVQQEIINKVVEAVKLAETSRKAEDIEAAKKLVADLGTATSEAIKKVAADMTKKVETVKPYDILVKTAVMDRTKVKVTFDKLEKAIKGASLEVKNPAGEVVSVEDKLTALIEGETEATFYFTKSIAEKDMVGVWTVNGYEVNLDHIKLIADAKEAASASVGEKASAELFDVLADSGLVDGLEDSLAAHKLYHNNLKETFGVNKITNLADLQKVIDDTNSEMNTGVKAYEIVKVAVDGTLRQFTTIVNKSGLKRVNEEFLSEYKAKINADYKNDKTVTYTQLQKVVDDKNVAVVNALFDSKNAVTEDGLKELSKNGVLNAELINKYLGYAENYTVLDSTKASYKTDLKNKEEKIKNLNILLSVTDVINADTVTSLKSALAKFETAVGNDKVFSYDKSVNENNLQYLLKGFGLTTKVLTVKDNSQYLGDKETLSSVQSVVGLVNNANSFAKLYAFDLLNNASISINANTGSAKASDAQIASVKTALQTLEKATAKENNVVKNQAVQTYNKFEYKFVDSDLLETYGKNFVLSTHSSVDSLMNSVILRANSSTVISTLKGLTVAGTDITKSEALVIADTLESVGIKNVKSDNLTKVLVTSIVGAANTESGKETPNAQDLVKAVQVLINQANYDVAISNEEDVVALAKVINDYIISTKTAAGVYENNIKYTDDEGISYDYLNMHTAQKQDVVERYLDLLANDESSTAKDILLANALEAVVTDLNTINDVTTKLFDLANVLSTIYGEDVTVDQAADFLEGRKLGENKAGDMQYKMYKDFTSVRADIDAIVK